MLTSEAIRVTRREAGTRSALVGPSVFAGFDAATPRATEQSDGSGVYQIRIGRKQMEIMLRQLTLEKLPGLTRQSCQMKCQD